MVLDASNRIFGVVGPPCVGKGTVADKLKKAGHTVLSMSGILSQIESARSYMADGKMVPDSIVLPALYAEIARCAGTVFVDGMPRTMDQYLAMRESVEGFSIIGMELPVETLVARAESRVVCSSCNRSSSRNGSIPKCCGSPMVSRTDDSQIHGRILLYHQVTAPVLKRSVSDGVGHKLDAAHGSDQIFDQIMAHLTISTCVA